MNFFFAGRTMAHCRIERDRLESVGDLLCFRDPRGRSRTPSLRRDRGDLLVEGSCLLLHEYRVSKEAGMRFTGVTRDPNPIHVHDEIVPGSLTVSKVMIPVEVLFPRHRITNVRAKFTGASFYGQRTVARFHIQPDRASGRIAFEVTASQSGRTIAKLELTAVPRGPRPPRAQAPADRETLALVHQYLDCLNVDSTVAVERNPEESVEYPLGFLASLPSGEMVRSLRGEGGMLNVLSLEFPADLPVPVGGQIPAVELSQGKKRPTFNRIITRITDGLRLFGSGFALVHAQAAL